MTPEQVNVTPGFNGLREGTLHPARDIKAGNFAWLAKPALERIQGSFSESNNIASALAVYLALAWLASDHADAPFRVAKGLVSYRAGVSIRTAGDVLKKLEAISLVRVERQKAESGHPDAPNRYTLLPVGNGCSPVGNGCSPVGNGCSPVGNGRFQPSLPTCINKGRTKGEETEKKPSSPKAREVSFDASTVEGIYQAYPRKVAKAAALKAIAKALATLAKRPELPDPAAWLLKRVQAYAASPAAGRSQFTPHPATWFNVGRFDDDPAEWQADASPRTGGKAGVNFAIPLTAF